MASYFTKIYAVRKGTGNRKKMPKGQTPGQNDANNVEMNVSVQFLEKTPPLIVKYDKFTSGQQLFDRVCSHLQLLERGYFGLRFDADDGERYWLDALRTVHKQLKNVYVKVLNFRVRYYPPKPTTLAEDITRYYLFLQLRRDLSRGRLLCSNADAIELAALVVQSEMGDYEAAECPQNYVSEFKLLPRQNAKQEERIAERHKELRGLVPADAEARFLERACALETYGVDPFVVQCSTAIERHRKHAEEVPETLLQATFIGAHHRGVLVYCAPKPTLTYLWQDIANITYESKLVHLHLNGQSSFAALAAASASSTSTTVHSAGTGNGDVGEGASGSKKRIHSYKCETGAASRSFWLIAVDQRAFFTLPRGADAQRLKSGSRMPLLHRNSKFRFSGRSEREMRDESKRITREPPAFVRTPSTRAAHEAQARRRASFSNTKSNSHLSSMNSISDGVRSQPVGAGQQTSTLTQSHSLTLNDTYAFDLPPTSKSGNLPVRLRLDAGGLSRAQLDPAALPVQNDRESVSSISVFTVTPVEKSIPTPAFAADSGKDLDALPPLPPKSINVDLSLSNIHVNGGTTEGPTITDIDSEPIISEAVVKRDVFATVAASPPSNLGEKLPQVGLIDLHPHITSSLNDNTAAAKSTEEVKPKENTTITASSLSGTAGSGSTMVRVLVVALSFTLFLAIVLVVALALVFEETVELGASFTSIRQQLLANVYVIEAQQRIYAPVRRTVLGYVNESDE